jgi:hypothetical protein
MIPNCGRTGTWGQPATSDFLATWSPWVVSGQFESVVRPARRTVLPSGQRGKSEYTCYFYRAHILMSQSIISALRPVIQTAVFRSLPRLARTCYVRVTLCRLLLHFSTSLNWPSWHLTLRKASGWISYHRDDASVMLQIGTWEPLVSNLVLDTDHPDRGSSRISSVLSIQIPRYCLIRQRLLLSMSFPIHRPSMHSTPCALSTVSNSIQSIQENQLPQLLHYVYKT